MHNDSLKFIDEELRRLLEFKRWCNATDEEWEMRRQLLLADRRPGIEEARRNFYKSRCVPLPEERTKHEKSNPSSSADGDGNG